ncbi:MAG: hypothetical protein WCK89_23630, partial [bacterium]
DLNRAAICLPGSGNRSGAGGMDENRPNKASFHRPTQRLKRSGMAWTPRGGQAILTLRSLIQSNRWPHAWAVWAADCRQPVIILDECGQETLPLAVELASVLRSARGMVAVSGYSSALYDELYCGWKRVSVTARNVRSQAVEEVLWLSPNLCGRERQLDIFQETPGG